MNIIYVIEDYSENGGVERIVSDKANTLSTRYNHNITLISHVEDYSMKKAIAVGRLEYQKGCHLKN